MAICKSCGQLIEWIKTKKGKAMPVDPEYFTYENAEPGTLLFEDDGSAIKVDPNRDPEHYIRGRISHFSTCPQADEHRKK